MYPVQFAQSDGIIIRYNKNAMIRQQYTGRGILIGINIIRIYR